MRPRARRSAGRSRTARPARSGSARPSASTRCRRSPPHRAGATVAIGVAKWTGPSQPSPIDASARWTVAMLPTPPHWATSQPPGRSTAARFANSASWSRTQWKVAVDRIASTLALDRERTGRGRRRRSSIRSPNRASRSRAAAIIAGEPSRAMTRPRGRRAASSSVTRPLPQPASRTRLVAGQRQAVEDGAAPARLGPATRSYVAASQSRVTDTSGGPGSGDPRVSRCRRRLGRGRRTRRGRAGPLAQPEPRHQRADHEQPRAHQHRQVERVDRGLVRGGHLGRRRAGPGGLSGWKVRRTAGSDVSSAGQRSRARRSRWR